jgi:hypothetical protein
MNSSIKIGSPEIRVGMDGSSTRSGMGGDNFPKMPKQDKVIIKPKKRMPKAKKK